MIENWKKGDDNGGVFGALKTDLCKTFDCLDYELLIAKLDAYGCLIEIEHFSEFLYHWFDFNYMKISIRVSHILFSKKDVNLNVDNNAITYENKNKLLSIVLDSKLCFEEHINSLCLKARKYSLKKGIQNSAYA